MGVIKKQGISNTIISFIGIILGSVSVLYVQPKLLKPSEIGLLNVMFSFAQIFGVLIPMGMGNVAYRYFSKIPNRYKGSNGLLAILFLISIVGFFIIGSLLYIFKSKIIELYSRNSPEVAEIFLQLLLFSFIISTVSIMTVYSSIHFKTSFPSFLSDIYVRTALIVLVLCYTLLQFDSILLPWLYMSIFIIQALLLLYSITRFDYIWVLPKFDFFKTLPLKSMFQYGFLMMFTSIASIGIKFINNLILAVYLPLEIVGVYALAVFMSAIMDAPGTALEKIAFPKVAEAITNNKMEEVKKIYYDSSKYLLLLGCFLFTMIYVNIDFFYYLVPEIYSEGKYAVLLLCVASLFNLATGVNNSIIFNSRKYYWGSIFLFLLIVLAIVNNIYLIPIMGLSGAALAMAISIFVYNFLKYIYIWWHWKLQPFEWSSLKSIFVLMLCISVNKFVPNGSNAIFSIMIHTSIIGSVFLLLTHLTNIAPELYMPYVKKWFEKN